MVDVNLSTPFQFRSLLDVALEHHRAGRLAEARQGYQQVLAQDPQQPDALHLLGLLAHQAGQTAVGIEHLERAISLKPDPQFLSNLGEVYRAAGQFDRGLACCQRAVALAPSLASAQINLAACLQASGRLDEALAAAQHAVTLPPQDGSAHRVLGNLLITLGRLDEAATALQRSVQLNPQDAAAWTNLGILSERRGQMDAAMQCHARAVQLSPQSADMLNNLGHVLGLCGRNAEAVQYFQRALHSNPNFVEAQANLAVCLEQLNRFDESIALLLRLIPQFPSRIDLYCTLANALMWSTRLEEAESWLRKALAIAPGHGALHQILAVCLTRLGRYSESVAEIDRAIAAQPDWVEAHFSKALILMFAARLEEAWPCYEWRWKHPRMDKWRHTTDKPLWDGRPLDGKRIFLYAEQGLGDTMQAIRYVPLIAQRGGQVIVEVQQGLGQLIKSVPGVSEVIERGDTVPPFDTHAAIMSLPGIFRTSVATIPAGIPYITADPAKVDQWRQIIGTDAGVFKVGIVWEGGPFLRENFLRSATLAAFAPLAAVPNVRFYSLQKGPASRQASQVPPGMDLVDLDSRIKNFSDTAAAIANLDLVIAIDTAVIHLAGAMGKPVWNLVALNLSGHMWMHGRDDTPWYPTMRLFRQPKLGDWPSVMARVTKELGKLVAAKSCLTQ